MVFDPTTYRAPRRPKFDREAWLKSHGYHLMAYGTKFVLKSLPVGNTEAGFVPCSVEPDIWAKENETLIELVNRVHPEWMSNIDEFKRKNA